ncbi:26.2 kDa heat shock protein, mitochondrial-like isoform X2 [Panicum miliaceum]|uniref:26.2 kDa heat shock protein, mitochondrial-like isoform X2 n=1 Tax=Panicum miliaceum TaxID=4540 RepID=A0A3L6PAW5_PANMI|nr:26.2 kDa heat shock protein, mitochondrial-like isoform X2 [Panicum miliaceum]
MASAAVVVNGPPMAGHLKELPAAPSAFEKPVASALCLLNTKGGGGDDTSEKPSGKDTVDGRLALDLSVPKRFSTGALDLFGEPSKLLQLLALTEDGGAASATGLSGHGWWVSKEDDDAVQLKVAMPGLGKEHVKVSAEKNILVINGEGDKDPEDRKGPARYTRRVQLPAEAFKMDQIKAEMNNGVLKVTVPKIKAEERKDVFQIKVE